MDNPMFMFLVVVDNRVTEAIKRALVAQFPNLKDEFLSLLVLLISFIVGGAGVIFFFPSANIFAGQGVTLFAEQIATGIVLGGLANGVDFLGGALGDLLDKVSGTSTKESTITVVETEKNTPALPLAG